MSQAELAGGQLSPAGQYPRRGYRLRDFTLKSVEGREVAASDYRGRRNLILLLAGDAQTARPVLTELAQHYPDFQEEEAQLLIVIWDSNDAVERLAHRLPFPLFVDDGHTHGEFGAIRAGKPAPALYITDRYGEVFSAYRTATGQVLPGWEEILDWLSFINNQCPECEAPEWPL